MLRTDFDLPLVTGLSVEAKLMLLYPPLCGRTVVDSDHLPEGLTSLIENSLRTWR